MKIEKMNSITILTADPGMTFADKNNNIVGSTLWLGINDSTDNYIETLIPDIE